MARIAVYCGVVIFLSFNIQSCRIDSPTSVLSTDPEMNISSGLQKIFPGFSPSLWYTFTNDVTDKSGNHKGIIVGTGTYRFLSKVEGYGLQFLTAPTYVSIMNAQDMDTVQEFTVEATVQIDKMSAGHMTIMCKGASGNDGWTFAFRDMYNSGNQLAFWLNGIWYMTDIYFPVTSRKIQLVATVKYGAGNGRIDLYAGGRNIKSFAGLTISAPKNKNPYRIGMGNSSPADQLFGKLYDIRYYGRALDTTEIAMLFIGSELPSDKQLQPLAFVVSPLRHVGTWQGATLQNGFLWMQSDGGSSGGQLYKINTDSFSIQLGYPKTIGGGVTHGGSIKYDQTLSLFWVIESSNSRVYMVDPNTGKVIDFVDVSKFFALGTTSGRMGAMVINNKVLYLFQYDAPSALVTCYAFRLATAYNATGRALNKEDLYGQFYLYLGNQASYQFGIQGAANDPVESNKIWVMYSSAQTRYSALVKIDLPSSLSIGRAQISEYREIPVGGMEDIAITQNLIVYTGSENDGKIYKYDVSK
jgi:hypothetical protein